MFFSFKMYFSQKNFSHTTEKICLEKKKCKIFIKITIFVKQPFFKKKKKLEKEVHECIV